MQSPEQVQDVSKQSYAARYSVLVRERQSCGSGCDEEFDGYGSGTGGRRSFVYAFKRSQGGQTVDVGAKDKGHYTFTQES